MPESTKAREKRLVARPLLTPATGLRVQPSIVAFWTFSSHKPCTVSSVMPDRFHAIPCTVQYSTTTFDALWMAIAVDGPPFSTNTL